MQSAALSDWKKKSQDRINEIKAKDESLRQEMQEKAKKEIDDFYLKFNQRREKQEEKEEEVFGTWTSAWQMIQNDPQVNLRRMKEVIQDLSREEMMSSE